jgi:hypothetical protein
MRLVILALTRAFGICPGAVTTMAVVVVRLRILTRFISYSHALDGALAQALQTGLERFAKPWYRQRALRVFRDTTNLAASPGLWSSIEEALASSVWLVLMASPEAARSKWVNREVAWWLNNKSPQRLLVVLTEGEFAWDEKGGRAPPALPPALHGAFVETPRWWIYAGYTTRIK